MRERKGFFKIITAILYILLIISAAILIMWARGSVIEFKEFSTGISKVATQQALFKKALAADCITAKDSRGQPIKFVYSYAALVRMGKSGEPFCLDLGENAWQIKISFADLPLATWSWGDTEQELEFQTAVAILDDLEDTGVYLGKFEFGTNAADVAKTGGG